MDGERGFLFYLFILLVIVCIVLGLWEEGGVCIKEL